MAAVEEKNATNHPISPAAHRSTAPNPISKSNYVETSSATTRDRNNNSLEKLDTESIEMPPTVDEDIDMNVNIVDSFIFQQSIAAKLSSTIIPDENDEGLIEVSSTAYFAVLYLLTLFSSFSAAITAHPPTYSQQSSPN